MNFFFRFYKFWKTSDFYCRDKYDVIKKRLQLCSTVEASSNMQFLCSLMSRVFTRYELLQTQYPSKHLTVQIQQWTH